MAKAVSIQAAHREEIQLVEAAKKKPERFGPIYDRYYKPIFVFIHRRVGDEDVTADLTSQVFLKAMVNLKKFEYRGYPFSSWLFRIALNETNMFFRKSSRNLTVPLNEDQVGALAQEVKVDNTEHNQEQLVGALNQLPREQAQLIELRFFEKYSFKQIADLFGITEPNAKMRVYRILKKMKKFINLKD